MRLEFTDKTKDAALKRSNGICECHRVPTLPTYGTGCGQRLGSGNTFYEHINQAFVADDNSLDNCAALVRTCWKLKTNTVDKPVVARVKRKRRSNFGIKERKGRPMPGTKASGIRKRFGGKIERW